jgi:hypothetical protein
MVSLNKLPHATIQIGSILLVKVTGEDGPQKAVRTLSQSELVYLENNQGLLAMPEHIL